MKNTIRIGIVTLAVIIMFAMAACEGVNEEPADELETFSGAITIEKDLGVCRALPFSIKKIQKNNVFFIFYLANSPRSP